MVTTMWNDELILKSITYTEDEIGNQIPIESSNTVFCDVKSISRSEFYNASVAGLKPSLTFIIKLYEYSEETMLEYNSKQYKVIRNYRKNSEEIELTCEEVAGNG